MKNILAPVDFSDASHIALKYTAELARCLNASIRLLHIYSTAGSRQKEEQKQAIDEGVKKLKSLIDSLGPRYSTLTWETQIETGSVVDVILGAAKKNCDMISMGTQ